MKNVKREYKDPYFFLKPVWRWIQRNVWEEKKIPQHVLLKPSFYTSLFSFIRLCSFSSSDTTATSSKKKQKHSSPPLQISQVRPLAYVADQSYAAFSAPPHPGSSIKNNIACTVRIAPFSAQLSLNKSTRSLPVSSARTTAAGFCFCCYSVYWCETEARNVSSVGLICSYSAYRISSVSTPTDSFLLL